LDSIVARLGKEKRPSNGKFPIAKPLVVIRSDSWGAAWLCAEPTEVKPAAEMDRIGTELPPSKIRLPVIFSSAMGSSMEFNPRLLPVTITSPKMVEHPAMVLRSSERLMVIDPPVVPHDPAVDVGDDAAAEFVGREMVDDMPLLGQWRSCINFST